jgi:phage shock protein A
MTQNLRSRVAKVIAASAHSVLDKWEDANPVAMLEQSARELEQVSSDVRAELGVAVANRHLTQQQHVRLNQEHTALADAISTAIVAGRDDLAKPAVARQIDIEAQLPVLEDSLVRLASEEKELSAFVEALMGKKREMQRAVQEFEKSRREARSTVGSNAVKSSHTQARVQAAQDAFDRTLQRQTGIEGLARGATLEQASKIKELGDIVRDNKINERLAALKAAQ